eukprot:364790-Chlamydomonas_euryale.AAC.10
MQKATWSVCQQTLIFAFRFNPRHLPPPPAQRCPMNNVGRPQALVGWREAQLLQLRQLRQLLHPVRSHGRAAQVQERDGTQELHAPRQLPVVDREVVVEVERHEAGQRGDEHAERVAAHAGALAQRQALQPRQAREVHHARVAQLLLLKVQLLKRRDAREVGQALVAHARVAQVERHQQQARQRQQALVGQPAPKQVEVRERAVALERLKRAVGQLVATLERQRVQVLQVGQHHQTLVGHTVAVVQVEAREARHLCDALQALVGHPRPARVVAKRQRLQLQAGLGDERQAAVANVGAVGQVKGLQVGEAFCQDFRPQLVRRQSLHVEVCRELPMLAHQPHVLHVTVTKLRDDDLQDARR